MISTKAQLSMEYFIDLDPGFGHANPVSLAQTTNTQLVTLDVSTIKPGLHQMFLRIKNETGIWSLTASRIFIVTGQSINPNLAKAEYFYDIDPGVGQGNTIEITEVGLPELVTLDVSSMTTGFHQLYMRVQDNQGNWSITNSAAFVLIGSHSQPEITNMEYFFDTDPGFGNGVPMAIGRGTSIDQMHLLDVSNLTSGEHTLIIRTQSEDGQWSITQTDSFLICTPPSPPTADQNTIALCVDEGISTEVNMTVTSPASDPTFRWYDRATADRTLLEENITGSYTATTIDRDSIFYVSVVASGCESGVTAISVDLSLFPETPVIERDPIDEQTLVSSVTGDLQWFFEGEVIAGATSQSLTPTRSGSYQVSITSAEDCESFSEEFLFEVVTGINDDWISQIRIYPNPAKNLIQIRITGLHDVNNISITDLSGRQWNQGNAPTRINGLDQWSLDIQHLPQGVYILSISRASQRYNSRFIKQW